MSENYKDGRQTNKMEGMKTPVCFLKEGRDKEMEGKRSHYRREWLPFVPP